MGGKLFGPRGIPYTLFRHLVTCLPLFLLIDPTRDFIYNNRRISLRCLQLIWEACRWCEYGLGDVDLGERLGRGVMHELALRLVKYEVSKLYNKPLLRRA